MSAAPSPHAILRTLRRLVLALVAIGLAGVALDLLLLTHYEDAWQIVPLVVLGLTLLVLMWHAVTGSGTSVRAVQVTMLLLIATSGIGLVLHYQSNLGFQVDMDPTQSAWMLFQKVIRAHAPPAMAPAFMAELGLLGLAYTYRHPALTDADASRDIAGD